VTAFLNSLYNFISYISCRSTLNSISCLIKFENNILQPIINSRTYRFDGVNNCICISAFQSLEQKRIYVYLKAKGINTLQGKVSVWTSPELMDTPEKGNTIYQGVSSDDSKRSEAVQ